MSGSNELRLYRENVEGAMSRAIASGKPEVFENTGPAHARVVIETMLDHASSSLDVVSDAMDGSVWSADHLRSFMQRAPTARIRALLKTHKSALPTSSALAGFDLADRVEVRRVPVDLEEHFCVVDRQHVRLEYNRGTREASVTFADAGGVGAKASVLFERLWNLCGATPAAAPSHAS